MLLKFYKILRSRLKWLDKLSAEEIITDETTANLVFSDLNFTNEKPFYSSFEKPFYSSLGVFRPNHGREVLAFCQHLAENAKKSEEKYFSRNLPNFSLKLIRRVRCKEGNAHHVRLNLPPKYGRQENFEIKVIYRNKFNKNRKPINLSYGGEEEDYFTVKIHIRLNGKRCFSGEITECTIPILDGDLKPLSSISYLRKPLKWAEVLYSIKRLQNLNFEINHYKSL